MVLAGTLTASDWSYTMQTPKINYILEHLPKPPQKCPLALLQILDGWERTAVDELYYFRQKPSRVVDYHYQHETARRYCTN
jgi:hypothetical protein